MSHTPQFNGRCTACTHDYRSVVILCSYHAAAPELVAACHDAGEWLTLRHGEPPPDAEQVNEYHRVILQLRAALARAKGE